MGAGPDRGYRAATVVLVHVGGLYGRVRGSCRSALRGSMEQCADGDRSATGAGYRTRSQVPQMMRRLPSKMSRPVGLGHGWGTAGMPAPPPFLDAVDVRMPEPVGRGRGGREG